MTRWMARLTGALAVTFAIVLIAPHQAVAVPSFATQTGYACVQCHIGAYGPQLTPFGRAFKIGGYTQTGGEGWPSYVPLSAMLLGSFTHTGNDLPTDAIPTHYGPNNNFALDQISWFLAGRISSFAGGFAQFTYHGVADTVSVDNTDLRPFTTLLDLGGSDLRIGITVNNNPTVQDPYGSSYAWGFPYVASPIAPVPAASPVLVGGFAANSVGVTGYAWYDHALYLEAGGYGTLSSSALKTFGTAYGPGSENGLAPYLRAAYEWNWNGQSAHIGAIFLSANVNPAIAPRQADGTFGANAYTDIAIDAGYQFLGDGTNVAAVYAILDHENQSLRGAFNSGGAAQAGHDLNQVRVNAQYWREQTYGLTLGWQNTWGTADSLLYAPAPVTGSVNGRPNSNAFTIEADWVPFGKDGSWSSPWANLKIGLQYVAYTQFNGGGGNYDGFGRNASANNTLYLFAWTIF